MPSSLEPPSYSVAGGIATSLESTTLLMGDVKVEARPPSYRETPAMGVAGEKTSGAELVLEGQTISPSVATNIITSCPTILPQAYRATQQHRDGFRGCCASKVPLLDMQQTLSTASVVLREALQTATAQKPTSKAEAKINIKELKGMRREAKRLRSSCHLSCQEKRVLKMELGPLETDVKAVLRNLKKEKCRMC